MYIINDISNEYFFLFPFNFFPQQYQFMELISKDVIPVIEMSHWFFVINFLLGLMVVANSAEAPPLVFPLQFSATLTITAHLVDESSEYPPRTRQMMLYYDYINKKARADIEAGYEAAKIYFRRYDQKNEYMVRLPPINDCKRSYLGEVMPFPDIPDVEYEGLSVIDGVECNHYVHEDYDTVVRIYMSAKDGAPVRLVQESIIDTETDIGGDGAIIGQTTPLLTYDYTDVVLEAPEESLFELQDPYHHKACTRHVGGFPYLHVFHYFVRF